MDKDKNGFMVPRERPAAVLGITERVRTGHGTMYVTVNFDEDNKPFELFTAIGKGRRQRTRAPRRTISLGNTVPSLRC